MKPGFNLLAVCLAALLAGCESTESSYIVVGNIIEDVEAYRLTSITENGTESIVDFVVILRASTGDKPYLRLSGGDALTLLVDGELIPFLREDDNVTDVIRYTASWSQPIETTTTVTVRFSRRTGAAHDSSATLNAAPVVTEPDGGFEWNPETEDLVVTWQNAEPPVDYGAVFTACTRYYPVLDTSGLSFTVPQDALLRTDTSINPCPGYVELSQETVEGIISAALDEDSSFIVDQTTQIAVTANY